MNSSVGFTRKPLLSALASMTFAVAGTAVQATEPCGEFGECKVLIEINASDGDIGFHFLADGDNLESLVLLEPKANGRAVGRKIFQYKTFSSLRAQTLTETFAESAEPLCYDPTLDDDEENDDEDFVTLGEFLERWSFGTYTFRARNADKENLQESTELTNLIPAAPDDVDFDPATGVISWSAGDDLDACSDAEFGLEGEFEMLVNDGEIVLVTEPDLWEVVLEPDVEDGDPVGSLVYRIRVPGDISPTAITVPRDYLDSLPDDTAVKVEVGGIAGEDNATFTEADGFCVNEVDGCDEED